MEVESAVYRIGPSLPSPSKARYGGKAFGLYQIMKPGIPVPPAYVITVETCRSYMQNPEAVMSWVREEALPYIRKGLTGDFGYMPLVSVRSGAPVSMPGMMDTILNVGLDPSNLIEWNGRLGIECASDCLTRLDYMYKKVVGSDFPDTADEQIVGCIEAVFKSWANERAVLYRKLNGIPDDMGTAVVVQAMVFGNYNEKSGTGVAFSRDYSTGENKATGNFLPTEVKDGVLKRAQGEDVVAGAEGAYPLSKLKEWDPVLAAQLLEALDKLEALERDMVDTEFTIQDGKFYMLQVRAGKRTAQAALKVAIDLFNEKVISLDEALSRVTLQQFLAATRPTIPPVWMAANPPHGVGELDQAGFGASVGTVTGVAVFSNEEAINCTEPCILVREQTMPDDISGMNAAVGILTEVGAITCHAAVVGRGMDKVVVVGCNALTRVGNTWVLGHGVKRLIKAGTRITLDGPTASVWVDTDVPVEGENKTDLSSKFLDLLSEKYDFYRTVTNATEVNGAKKVLLATYNLDRQFSGKALKTEVSNLLAAAEDRDVVIDLRTFEQVCREADKPLELLWGPLEDSASAIDFKLQGIAACTMTGAEKSRVKILEFGLTSSQVDSLGGMGFVTIPVVSTLAQLLAATELCVADFDALVTAAGKDEVLKILDLKKAKGELVRSFNIVDKVNPETLGRNAVFALSAMQAAQCLLIPKGE